MIHMIGEWLISKVPGPLVPVVAVLYGLALDVRDELGEEQLAAIGKDEPE